MNLILAALSAVVILTAPAGESYFGPQVAQIPGQAGYYISYRHGAEPYHNCPADVYVRRSDGSVAFYLDGKSEGKYVWYFSENLFWTDEYGLILTVRRVYWKSVQVGGAWPILMQGEVTLYRTWDGKTWERIPVPRFGTLFLGFHGKPLLVDGKMLFTAQAQANPQPDGSYDRYSLIVCWDGREWSVWSEFHERYSSEMPVVVARDCTWVAAVRMSEPHTMQPEWVEVWTSRDQGHTWEFRQRLGSGATYPTLFLHPSGEIWLALRGLYLWRSVDNGATFGCIGQLDATPASGLNFTMLDGRIVGVWHTETGSEIRMATFAQMRIALPRVWR